MGLLEFLWLICEVSLPSRCNWNTMLLAFSEPVGSTIFQDIVWGWSRWKTHGLTVRIPRRTHFNISCFACTSGSSRETRRVVTKTLLLAEERGGERGDRGGESGRERERESVGKEILETQLIEGCPRWIEKFRRRPTANQERTDGKPSPPGGGGGLRIWKWWGCSSEILNRPFALRAHVTLLSCMILPSKKD